MPFATLLSLCVFAGSSIAAPNPVKRATTPQVSGTPTVVGFAGDNTLNRDSCTSVKLGTREFWTCRDSENYPPGLTFFSSSTASWSDFNANGTPEITNGNLTEYGTNSDSAAFFPIQSDECGPSTSGGCSDGTRWAIWPNSPPLPVVESSSQTSLFTWIPKAHINDSNFAALNPNPPTSLYRTDYNTSQAHTSLPPTTLVSEEFWAAGTIPYGSYGWVVADDTAYLYGVMNASSGVALAKVPVASIADQAAYQYYDHSKGAYSATAPSITDTAAAIPNAGTTGQGTYYFSSHFDSYIWIGAPFFGANAVFQIATAPAPEGPWTTPTTFYTGQAGSQGLGAYSQQAHPGLSAQGGNGSDIYLTYTKVDAVYSTPLIHVIWQ